MRLLIVAVVAFVASAGTAPVAARLALRTGIVDRPGALKVQDRPVPYLGGVAVAAGLVAGSVVSGRWSLLVPAALALALGLLDDVRSLPPLARLAGEVPIGIAVAVVVPTRFPVAAEVALCILATVALVNAVNMLDGLDGLAGGVTAAAAVGFAIVLGGGWQALAVALAAALVGFLVWNRPPARIYLGDGGAYLLGATLATLAAGAWRPVVSTGRSVAAMAFVAVPAWELATTVLRRRANRTKLTEGDRDHTYDRLARRGWSTARISAAVGLAQLVVTGAAATVALALT